MKATSDKTIIVLFFTPLHNGWDGVMMKKKGWWVQGHKHSTVSRGKAFIGLTVGHRVLVYRHTQRHCHEMYMKMLTAAFIMHKHACLG